MKVERLGDLMRIPTAADVGVIKFPHFRWFKSDLLSTVLEVYKYGVSCLVQQLRIWGLRWEANVVGALFWEPINSVREGLRINTGKEKEFCYYGMNPTSLTEKQHGSRPILALHGKNGSQGVFLPMAKAFQEAGIGPLFTLNLCEGELSMEDQKLIDKKVDAIQKLYGYKVPVDIIGYSRGAEIALYMGLPKGSWHIEPGGYCYKKKEWREGRLDIGRIFRIGSVTTSEEWGELPDNIREKIYEIRGSEDILMPEDSLAYHQLEVNEGHVGLPSSSAMHSWLIDILA